MNRRIARTYYFSAQEVREALVQWMRVKDLQAPQYVGNASGTKWDHDDQGGVRVEWTDDDTVEI